MSEESTLSVRALLILSLDKLFRVAHFLPMKLYLSLIAPHGSLNFSRAFALIGLQQTRMTAPCFRHRVRALCHATWTSFWNLTLLCQCLSTPSRLVLMLECG